MSIMDKMKGALNTVTGHAATVALEHTGTFGGGATLKVKVMAASTGAEVKASGVFVDLRGRAKGLVGQVTGNVHAAAEHSFKISEAVTLAAKESKAFEGEVTVPKDINPDLDWEIRARLETFGNDPDSGWKDIR